MNWKQAIEIFFPRTYTLCLDCEPEQLWADSLSYPVGSKEFINFLVSEKVRSISVNNCGDFEAFFYRLKKTKEFWIAKKGRIRIIVGPNEALTPQRLSDLISEISTLRDRSRGSQHF